MKTQNEIICRITADKFVSSRKRCAWSMLELLMSIQYNEKIENLYTQLRECDRYENTVCYDLVSLELEKMLKELGFSIVYSYS